VWENEHKNIAEFRIVSCDFSTVVLVLLKTAGTCMLKIFENILSCIDQKSHVDMDGMNDKGYLL
jgi:hypothetical protein